VSAASPLHRPGAPSALHALARAALRHQFLRFLAVGVLNTLFGYAIFLAALWLSGRSLLALVIATIIGVAFNFFSIGSVVFRSTERRLIWRFVAVYGVIFCVNALALRGLEIAGFGAALAQALLAPAMAALSYFLNKRWVFPRGEDERSRI
jgi:putative flippase GtrA